MKNGYSIWNLIRIWTLRDDKCNLNVKTEEMSHWISNIRQLFFIDKKGI